MYASQANNLGFGLGLRQQHFDYILTRHPHVDWFEIITEDFYVPGSIAREYLTLIRENYPVVMHGVSLSIGSVDPLDYDYLAAVKALADAIEPSWVSDHLCWTGVNSKNMHDLLPVLYTEAVLQHISNRVGQVQEFLGRQILLENPSSYVDFIGSEMTEWEFLSQLAQQADCKILLDLNNIYVSSYNHGFDPYLYLNSIPIDRVQQFHLAGHTNQGHVIIDTHDHPIINPVWQLYAAAVKRFGAVATMIERDDNIPEFQELLQELQQAKQIAMPILAKHAA